MAGRKLLRSTGGMQHLFPTSLPEIRRESQGVAGGSKWTYEATFRIAMKIGRKYSSTAAKCHDTQLNDTQHNDILNNDTQHKGLICDNQHK